MLSDATGNCPAVLMLVRVVIDDTCDTSLISATWPSNANSINCPSASMASCAATSVRAATRAEISRPTRVVKVGRCLPSDTFTSGPQRSLISGIAVPLVSQSPGLTTVTPVTFSSASSAAKRSCRRAVMLIGHWPPTWPSRAHRPDRP